MCLIIRSFRLKLTYSMYRLNEKIKCSRGGNWGGKRGKNSFYHKCSFYHYYRYRWLSLSDINRPDFSYYNSSRNYSIGACAHLNATSILVIASIGQKTYIYIVPTHITGEGIVFANSSSIVQSDTDNTFSLITRADAFWPNVAKEFRRKSTRCGVFASNSDGPSTLLFYSYSTFFFFLYTVFSEFQW